MNKFAPIELLATVATIAFVPTVVFAAETNQQVQQISASVSGGVAATTGRMLYGADGHRVANVYRVAADGSAQIILDGKLVTVPVATLSQANGKLTTSLSRTELRNR